MDENLAEKHSTKSGFDVVGDKMKTPVSWLLEPNFCNTTKRNVITKSKSKLIKLTEVFKNKLFPIVFRKFTKECKCLFRVCTCQVQG